jgi:hypothetical protein
MQERISMVLVCDGIFFMWSCFTKCGLLCWLNEKRLLRSIFMLFNPFFRSYLLKHVQHHHSNRVSFIHLLFHLPNIHTPSSIMHNHKCKKGNENHSWGIHEMIEMDEYKKCFKQQSTFLLMNLSTK